jgi:DNA-directed RNA polymerase subunit beta'
VVANDRFQPVAATQVQQEVTAAIEAEERELEQMLMEGEQEEMAAE